MSLDNKFKKNNLTFSRFFRLIFVIFFLYLMGDAFYRWNGFRYYASFSEFIPSLSLVSILWTIIAAITATCVLILTRSVNWISSLAGKKIQEEKLLLFMCYLIIFGGLAWFAKRNILGGGSTLLIKVVILFIVLITAAFITSLSSNYFNAIQERITPLVFLFGFLVLVSPPIVTYDTWLKKPEKTATQSSHKFVDDEKQKPNIILITFDALSSLDMSAYGYYRDTTPFIKKWSKKATLFKRAYSAGTLTSPTTASLMTGTYSWTHLRFNPVHVGKLAVGKAENIAYELKRIGYNNYAIAANANAQVQAMGINGCFYCIVPWAELFEPTNVSGYVKKWLYYMFGEKIRLYEWLVMPDFALDKILSEIPIAQQSKYAYRTETVIHRLSKIIDTKLKEPYFIWIHFWPPHYPYTPPGNFQGIFNGSSALISQEDQNRALQQFFWKELDKQSINERLKTFRSRYDENVLYCDKTFESVIKLLENNDQLKNSTIILSADHGESFRSDGLGHDGILYEPVTRIPLIIKEPGQNRGRIIKMRVHQTDISATILDIAGINRPVWVEGRSLIPLMHGGELPPNPLFATFLLHNVSGHKITKGQIATWEGDYKLIYDLEKETSLLFNLKKDPGELDNLINREPEKGKHLLEVIKTNLKRANDKIKAGNS